MKNSADSATQPRLHIYTGDGKGKTTACAGLAVRAIGAGHRAAFIQFDKGYDGNNEHYAERFVLRMLPKLALIPTGCERMRPDGTFRFSNEPADYAEAARGLAAAKQAALSTDFDLVVLDEAVTAAGLTGLIKEADLLALIAQWRKSGRCELVLSGRGLTPALAEAADLISEMKKVKHYFDDGQKARRGIEY
jgi:cob(I)alamin adenosyltransferase